MDKGRNGSNALEWLQEWLQRPWILTPAPWAQSAIGVNETTFDVAVAVCNR